VRITTRAISFIHGSPVSCEGALQLFVFSHEPVGRPDAVEFPTEVLQLLLTQAIAVARRRARAVVLEAPFPSARAVAGRVYWMVPYVGWALRTRLDIAGKIRRVRAPLLIVHCSRDRTIPFELGRQVYGLANEPKDFLVVEGRCHEGGLLEAAGFGARLRALIARGRPAG
jgi:pimeloyl-ACP methyl ester carboxylesterase